jgi:hypothetical protein
MNYDFYHNCTHMSYYDNDMYIDSIRNVIDAMNSIQSMYKDGELNVILNYYEL